MSIYVDDPNPLSLRQLNGTKWWLVLEDYTFRIYMDSNPLTIKVPAGYRYDRSSIPDCLEWIVSKDDLGAIGCLIHDVLYSCDGVFSTGKVTSSWLKWYRFSDVNPPTSCFPERKFSRREADDIFLAVMLKDKIKNWKAEIARLAVVWFARRW
jgi:hypothetical protein